jgi:hypothetical protein
MLAALLLGASLVASAGASSQASPYRPDDDGSNPNGCGVYMDGKCIDASR